MDDFEAYVYLPADPRLIRCAQNIKNAQVQALREMSEQDARELRKRQQGTLEFESYSTQHGGTEVVLISDERVPLSEAKRIERIAESVGVSMQKVMQIMSMAGYTSTEHEEQGQQEQSKEDRMDILRRKCNRMAFRLSKLLDVDVKEIHCKFKPQRDMTEAELQGKLDQMIRECNRVNQ